MTRGPCSAMSWIWVERARMLDHGAEAHAADRHAALALQLGHHLVEQAQMLHALGLGDEQRREARPHRGLDVGDRKPQRPIDAHGDVGAAPRHLLHRLGQHGARLGLLRRLHAVLEVDQHAVGAALVRLVDELGHIARHVEDRAPDGRSGTVGSLLLSLSRWRRTRRACRIRPRPAAASAAPRCARRSSARRVRSAPGVPDRRGTTGCVGSSPISSSGISISASRSST